MIQAKAAELNLRTPKAKTPVEGGTRRSARLSAAHSESRSVTPPASTEKGVGKRRGDPAIIQQSKVCSQIVRLKCAKRAKTGEDVMPENAKSVKKNTESKKIETKPPRK